ncbi:lipase family protein [Psychromonas aquimarina]|uniref:lipase family protein n=1 Tax=Psychromonas aquimarina TaxID=444919 RepID=UPI000402CE6E|nr:hypothetical protein [Psychromonas aquimarina]
MRIIFIFIFTIFSFNCFATESTYLQCYGIKDSFASRAQLIKKSWAVNDSGQYLKLDGYWKDNSFTADEENYFVVKSINSTAVDSAQVHQILTSMCSNTLEAKYSSDYTSSITYFASSHSYGYEYPALSEQQALLIHNGEPPLSYNKMLRYAFASSYVYSLEQGADPFSFFTDPVFAKLMQPDGAAQVQVIDTFKGESGVQGVALLVPAVDSENLEEEIIIAFKGTSSGWDVLQDVELMYANLVESDEDWQIDAYNFTRKVVQKYPPNSRSLADGYKTSNAEKTYNVVLTGHSLGGYTAIDAGVRSGILTRSFSSPATRIIEKYAHAFANKMRYNNIINLVREKDPVSTMSGRHNENMIYFPGADGIDPGRSHYLTPFINDILKPLYIQADNAQARPRYLYITADASSGAGLDAPVNYWGSVE